MRTLILATAMVVAVFTPFSAVYAKDHDKKDSTETHQTSVEKAHHAAPAVNHTVDTTRPVMAPPFFHSDHAPAIQRPTPVVVEEHHPVTFHEEHHPVVFEDHHPVIVEQARPIHVERHAPVVVVREGHDRPRFHSNAAALLTGIIIAGAIISSDNHPCCPPPAQMDPVTYARRQGTYYSCRAEALANFKAKYINIFTNNFATEPATHPTYIPTTTVYNGQTAYVVYCQQYQSYGFWDPADPNTWITYSVWDDDAVVNQLMSQNFYLYPVA